MADGEDVWANHERILKPLMERYGFPGLPIEREVYTGDSLRERKVFSGLLKRIEDGRVDALFLLDIDRLGRGRMSDAGRVLDTLLRREVLLITPEKVYDPVRDETDLEMLELRMFLARAELRAIKKRLYRAREVRAGEGYFTGGLAPYGYEVVRKRLAPKPGEIEWRVLAWHLRAAGWPRNQILRMFDRRLPFPPRDEVVAALRAAGLPTGGLPDMPASWPPPPVRAGHWRSARVLQKWFQSRLDEGFITWAGEHHSAPHGPQVPPAIVDAARAREGARKGYGSRLDNDWLLQVWDITTDPPQRMYGDRRTSTHRRRDGSKVEYHQRYYATQIPSGGPDVPKYRFIRADELEEAAVQYLFALRDDETLARRLERALQEHSGAPKAEERRGVLTKRLRQAEAALTSTLNRLKDPTLPDAVRDGYERNVAELAREAEATKKEMAALDAAAKTANRFTDHLAAARDMLRHLTPEWWAGLRPRDKKRLLQALIPRVEVKRQGRDWEVTFFTAFGTTPSWEKGESALSEYPLPQYNIPLGTLAIHRAGGR